MTTIYKITNKLNGKIYIGQTRQTIEKRFMQHAAAKTPLGHAMQDCGLENFTIEVIEECETKEQANDREQFWIKILKCKSPTGYNQCDGGAGVIGCTSSRHYRAKDPVAFKSGKMTVGEALKRFRNEFNLNQKEVAITLGILPQAYSRYESGRYQPRADDLITLSKAYGVTTDYLLGLVDEPRKAHDSEILLNALIGCRNLIQNALDHKAKGQ